MKDSCFMLPRNRDGGGNALFGASAETIKQSGIAMPLILRRTAAIGDALCASVIADRLTQLGFEVVMQTHPDIHCVMRKHPRLYGVAVPGGFCHVDLDGAYENDPQKRLRHFHEMFFEQSTRQLLPRGIDIGQPHNCKPKLNFEAHISAAVREQFKQYDKPWVMVCPRSDSYNVRQVPDGVWQSAAAKIQGTKFWIGRHPAPGNFVDLKCQHFDNVMAYLSVADLLVTVDTGPMHVAAALGIPIVAIYQSSSPEMHLNDQNDFISIAPQLDCLGCMQNICPKSQHLPPCQNIDPDFIASWANARLRSKFGDQVSAVIPIYQPEAATLNHCLEAVLPQVSEVIVTAQADSRIPPQAMRHEKIRYVTHRLPKLGYGRNTNHGARNSSGRYMLLLNDDVFLNPDAVEKMKNEMVPGVGMVAHLLRYPDGTIYHAGKARTPGSRGWGHIDHRKHLPTITTATEMENVCGASVLVRREAFYKIDGFDEDFYIYAEDDDFALRMRRAGYRIIYTPHATGVHMEHQSTQKIASITEVVSHANGVFGRKWTKYFDHNLNRVPGNFDYE